MPRRKGLAGGKVTEDLGLGTVYIPSLSLGHHDMCSLFQLPAKI